MYGKCTHTCRLCWTCGRGSATYDAHWYIGTELSCRWDTGGDGHRRIMAKKVQQANVSYPPPCAQEPACARTSHSFRSRFADDYFFAAENWGFMAVVDERQHFRHAGQSSCTLQPSLWRIRLSAFVRPHVCLSQRQGDTFLGALHNIVQKLLMSVSKNHPFSFRCTF